MAESKIENTTFSIVIPTYNRAQFIAETIKSVLQQDYPDFELIVVDDGSTDDTENVIGGIKDTRLTYHRQANAERAVARNTGVALSSGRYVTFLDSDDIIYAKHLTTALEVIKTHVEPEIFHLGYEITDVSSHKSSRIRFLSSIGNDDLVYGNFLSCQGVFLRSDIARKYQFNADRQLSGSEDYELWLRIASRYPIYCDNRITSTIIQHDTRSVMTTDREKLEKRINLLEKYLMADHEFVKKYGERISEFRANNRVYIALHLALTKNARIGAIGYLAKALLQSPLALKQRAFYGTLKRLFI